MERNALQYIVLTVGTVVFAILLYFIVQTEKGKLALPFAKETTDYNQITTDLTTVYSKPDNKSSVIATVSANTKVKTTSETKFYFRVNKIDGFVLHDGYISKRQLKRLQ